MIEADGIEVSEAVAALEAAVQRVLGVEPDQIGARAALGDVVGLERVQVMLDAARLARQAAADEAGHFALDGARSASAWLAARCDVTRGRCRRELRLAQQLRSTPVVATWFAEGRIGIEKVRRLIEARHPDVVEVFAEHEHELCATVARLSLAHAARYLATWTELARRSVGSIDPDEPEPEVRGMTRVHLSATFEGRYDLSGDLDATDGAALAALIEAEVARMEAQGQLTVADGEDPLPLSAVKGLALMALVLRGADPARAGASVSSEVAVVVDAATLARLPVDSAEDAHGRVSTVAGQPVGLGPIEHAMCTSDIFRVVVNAGGEVLDVGRAHRFATAAQRRLLRTQHDGCAFPGCSAPFRACDIHHIAPWDEGGTTDLANLAPLCRRHHRLIHRGGYRLQRDGDGTFQVTCPDRSPPTPAHLPLTPSRHDPRLSRALRRRPARTLLAAGSTVVEDAWQRPPPGWVGPPRA